MSPLLMAVLWLAALGTSLFAAEHLVRNLTQLGEQLHLRAGVLGFLVALGADSPEVTSALLALHGGAAAVGLGVILGSNIYNLAALLGLSAVIARNITTDVFRLSVDGGFNVLLTGLLLTLMFHPDAHVPLGLAILVVLLGFAVFEATAAAWFAGRIGMKAPQPTTTEPSTGVNSSRSAPILLLLVAGSVAFILIGSDLLVTESIALGKLFNVPQSITGTFVLAVATSLPNTWAAVSLARAGRASTAVASAFSSNSINVALGVGLPALALRIQAPLATRTVDAPWLAAMTVLSLILLASRSVLQRIEGAVLIAAYVGFVAVRLAIGA